MNIKKIIGLLILSSILFFLEYNRGKIFAEVISKTIPVKLFYPKDGKQNPSGTTNWYYYWRQFIPKGRIVTLIFDNSISGYASTNRVTRTTRVSQMASEYNDETTHKGIHTFYETLAHENHHIVLWKGWWPTGYNASLDTDGDFYPDAVEINDPDAITYGFAIAPEPKDAYGAPIPNPTGYRYEEDKCREIERNLNYTAYDNQDWSYDSTGVNQGKMWLILP